MSNQNIGVKPIDGDPKTGFTYGFFLQAGSFWASGNHFGDWSAGLSLPIK